MGTTRAERQRRLTAALVARAHGAANDDGIPPAGGEALLVSPEGLRFDARYLAAAEARCAALLARRGAEDEEVVWLAMTLAMLARSARALPAAQRSRA